MKIINSIAFLLMSVSVIYAEGAVAPAPVKKRGGNDRYSISARYFFG